MKPLCTIHCFKMQSENAINILSLILMKSSVLTAKLLSHIVNVVQTVDFKIVIQGHHFSLISQFHCLRMCIVLKILLIKI